MILKLFYCKILLPPYSGIKEWALLKYKNAKILHVKLNEFLLKEVEEK